MRVMDQSVYNGHCELIVKEEVLPMAELNICGDYDAFPFIA